LAFHNSTGNRISKGTIVDSVSDKKDQGSLEEVAALEPSVVEIKHASEPVVDLPLDYGSDDNEVGAVEEDEEEELLQLQLEKDVKRITTSQLNKYWAAKESLMKAPRAHFEKLGVAEKILREWDVDGRYGVSL
jgi:hypothetical protein